MAKKKAENTEVAEVAQEAVLPVEETPVKKTKKAPSKKTEPVEVAEEVQEVKEAPKPAKSGKSTKKKTTPAQEIAEEIFPEEPEEEDEPFDTYTDDDDLFADEELDDAAIEAQLEAAADALDPDSIEFDDEDFEEDLEDITNMKVPDDAYASGTTDDYSKDDQDDHYHRSTHGDTIDKSYFEGNALVTGLLERGKAKGVLTFDEINAVMDEMEIFEFKFRSCWS